jgi:hypothetical protein
MSPDTPAVIRPRDLAAIRRRAIRTGRAQARSYIRRSRQDVADGRVRRVWMWLPLTPLFLILAPFALLLAPLGYFVPPRLRPDPFQAVIALGAVLLSLGGTEIRVNAAGVHIDLRIF